MFNEIDPQYIKQARKELERGASETHAAESLMLMGISTLEANQAVSRAKAEVDRVQGFQRQSLIAAVLGLVGTVIGVGAAYMGTVKVEALGIAPTLLVFGGLGALISLLSADLALWLAKHPILIFIAAVISMIGSVALVFTWLIR